MLLYRFSNFLILISNSQEEGVVGRKNKKIVVFAIEKKGNGVGRVYGKVIKDASSKNLGDFMEVANIKTDKCLVYVPLKKTFKNLVQEKSEKKGKNFPLLHRSIMGFKGWMRGIHHKTIYLQAYIDEYCYRFNTNLMKEGIFENLLNRKVIEKPFTHKIMYENICLFLPHKFIAMQFYCMIFMRPNLIIAVSHVLTGSEFKSFKHPITSAF